MSSQSVLHQWENNRILDMCPKSIILNYRESDARDREAYSCAVTPH